jgi:hypothetical protein
MVLTGVAHIIADGNLADADEFDHKSEFLFRIHRIAKLNHVG